MKSKAARWSSLALVVALAAQGCAAGPSTDDAGGRDAGGRDAGSFFRDAGSDDGGSSSDGGSSGDAGAPGDAGSPSDGGSSTDAGGGTDAGAGTDAGPGADAGPGTDGGAGSPSLTVLTLNLQCLSVAGTAYGDNAARFNAIADAVVSEGVDVVAIQEACDDGSTDAREALRAAIAARAGTAWVGRWYFAHLANMGEIDEADEYVGLLAPAFTGPTLELVHRNAAGLRRVAVSDIVSVPSIGAVRITSVHFDHEDETRRRDQAREAAVATLAEAFPNVDAVIAGDLNALAGSPPHDALTQAGFVRSSDAVATGLIDHVFHHRGADLAVTDAQVLFDDSSTRVSDHPGVLVRYAPASGAAVTLTRIVALHDPGFGNNVSIRGDTAPLDFSSAGWPMAPRGAGIWHYVSSEWSSGTVEVKAVVNDITWQTGANTMVTVGADFSYTPSF